MIIHNPEFILDIYLISADVSQKVLKFLRLLSDIAGHTVAVIHIWEIVVKSLITDLMVCFRISIITIDAGINFSVIHETMIVRISIQGATITRTLSCSISWCNKSSNRNLGWTKHSSGSIFIELRYPQPWRCKKKLYKLNDVRCMIKGFQRLLFIICETYSTSFCKISTWDQYQWKMNSKDPFDKLF